MSASTDSTAIPAAYQEAIGVLEGRTASYMMLSRLFLKPLAQEDIDTYAALNLAEVAKELDNEGLLAAGFYDMGQALRKRHSGTRQQLATDYTMCFDAVEAVEGKVAAPYASVFLGEKALLNQEPRHRVYALFLQESLQLKANVGLPEDHLSFELEFLAVMSARAAEALSAGDVAEALRLLELSSGFIEDSILSWYGLLEDLALKIIKTRFYRGALKATRGYLELDKQTIMEIIEEIKKLTIDN